jgi:hypothetical protein
MKPIFFKHGRLKGLSLTLCMAAVSGCASVSPKPVVLAPPTPAAPMPAHATMAPIPNPPEHEADRDKEAARPEHPTKHAQTASTPTPSHAAAPPAVNPQRAAQLRAAGLEQLNRGAIHRAVALLEQASQLDPESALIRHDLDRAIRISRAVGTPR